VTLLAQIGDYVRTRGKSCSGFLEEAVRAAMHQGSGYPSRAA